jgi:hypothetical protein
MNKPDFYLASVEEFGEWAIPRACWKERQLHVSSDYEKLLVRVEPPVAIESEVDGRNRDVAYVVLSPHQKGDSLRWLTVPIIGWLKYPFPVYVSILLSNKDPLRDDITPEDLELVSWSNLYRSLRQATKALSGLEGRRHGS